MSKVLVSADGGLLELDLISGDSSLKVPFSGQIYGFCFVNNELYLPLNTGMKIFDNDYELIRTIEYPSLNFVLNPHQCIEHDGYLYITSTGNNKIVMFNLSTEEWTDFHVPDYALESIKERRAKHDQAPEPPPMPEGMTVGPAHVLSGTPLMPIISDPRKPITDLSHVNSILFDNNLMYIMCHNYGPSMVLIYDNFVLQDKILAGTNSHSLWKRDNDIWFCNSAIGRIGCLNPDISGHEVNSSAFLRGIAKVDEKLIIGTSTKRDSNIEGAITLNGVIVLNDDLSLNKNIPIDGDFVGDVVAIPSSFSGI